MPTSFTQLGSHVVALGDRFHALRIFALQDRNFCRIALRQLSLDFCSTAQVNSQLQAGGCTPLELADHVVQVGALYHSGDVVHEGDDPVVLNLAFHRLVCVGDVYSEQHRRDG